MKILIIPELTNKESAGKRSLEIERLIVKTSPNVSIANLFSLSIFSPKSKEYNTLIGALSGGYFVLKNLELHGEANYDVYIGFLDKEDYQNIDCIIYESEVAKSIFNERFLGGDILPKSRENVICGDPSEVAHEVYKRTIIRNISAK